jgi:porin
MASSVALFRSAFKPWPGVALAASAVLPFASPALAQSTPAQDPAPAGARLSVAYNSDGMGVVAGGLSRGWTYDGRLGLILEADLHEAAGWRGAAFHASIHQIHGRQPTAEHVGALMAVSGVEAERATRLFNLWVEQQLGDETSVRIGQFTAAQEFFISPTAALFVNSTFGWPAILAEDLPSGGPSYPLATPGVRLSYRPNPAVTILLAALNGDPAGPGGGDPQRRDRTGLNALRISGPPFLMAEAQYARAGAGGASRADSGLRVGGWTSLRATTSQRFDTRGLPLADPMSSGAPRPLSGQRGAYAILDHVIFQYGERRADWFVRIAATQSDRTLVSRYADLGVTYAGLLRGRPKDTVGLAAAYAGISKGTKGFDADLNRFSGSRRPARDHEITIELTYQAQMTSAWSLQPSLQYIVHPGGGAAGPDGARVRDAVVLGLRNSLRF